MSSKRNKTIHIGFSTILMVFTMLCLVTFATLSLLTANADYRLSKKVAAKTEDYYEADLLAREYLLQIDESLEELHQNYAGQKPFCQEALKRLQEMPMPQGITKSSVPDENSYSFETDTIRGVTTAGIAKRCGLFLYHQTMENDGHA